MVTPIGAGRGKSETSAVERGNLADFVPNAFAPLMNEGAAIQFAMDAFAHLKAIGASSAAKPLLDKAGVEADDGITGIGADFLKAAARRFYDREPKLRMLA